MTKQLLGNQPSCFDLKFMLVGSPGSGKTHMCATYTKGPIHLYMTDPNGEKTLYKLNQNRPEASPITLDIFRRSEGHTYETFWKTLQEDAKSGFFDDFKSRSGIVIFDSATSLALLALDSVAKKNQRTPGNTPEKGGMRRQDWGQRSAWLTELIRTLTDMPCAAILTVHLKRIVNEQTGAVIEQLNLPGQLSDCGGNFVDEVYKLKNIVKTRRIIFGGDGVFDQAKTRIFQEDSVDFKSGDPIMDTLVQAYYNNGKFSGQQSGNGKSQASNSKTVKK